MNNSNRIAYKTLFFDLDRTLWDYRANSEQTFHDLLNKYSPGLRNRFEEFRDKFYIINEQLWLQYRDGSLEKETLSTQRFVDVFREFNIDAELFAKKIADDYIIESPKKSKLFPNAIETLEYLKTKGYKLYLLTNGFLEVQKVKITISKLDTYFEQMITSEQAGFQKPNPKIFEYALKLSGADLANSIMIGDDLESDIMGAHNFGMDTVYFNPENTLHKTKPTFEISNLEQLKQIF